eukprot:c15716_g1_i2.p1 GENE.c15716_g1_i2~~c15716_g1_i2.p1  ORF type:complete len:282 (+),score=125.41 c15716_g1_i2:31-876(+)
MCLRLDCTVAFDCKGGQITPLLLDVLPPNSHLYLYGNLDGEVAAGINPNFLIEQNKHIHGFSLPNYLATLNNITLMSMKSKILALGSTTLSSTVQARFNLDQCAQAILFYANSIDSGKCLLMPDPQYQLDPSNNSLLIANIGEDGLNILEGFGNRDANGSVGSVGGGEGRLSEGRLSEGGLNEIIQSLNEKELSSSLSEPLIEILNTIFGLLTGEEGYLHLEKLIEVSKQYKSEKLEKLFSNLQSNDLETLAVEWVEAWEQVISMGNDENEVLKNLSVFQN